MTTASTSFSHSLSFPLVYRGHAARPIALSPSLPLVRDRFALGRSCVASWRCYGRFRWPSHPLPHSSGFPFELPVALTTRLLRDPCPLSTLPSFRGFLQLPPPSPAISPSGTRLPPDTTVPFNKIKAGPKNDLKKFSKFVFSCNLDLSTVHRQSYLFHVQDAVEIARQSFSSIKLK